MSNRDSFVNQALASLGDDGVKARTWFYGEDKPVDWCAIWVSYIGYLSGNQDLIGKYSLAGDTAEYGDGVLGEYIAPQTTPQIGDLIHFIWSDRPTTSKYSADHVGIVYNVADGIVFTVEGNSTNGLVASNSYSITSEYIAYYYRPKWSTGVTPLPPQVKNRKLPIWMYPKFFIL